MGAHFSCFAFKHPNASANRVAKLHEESEQRPVIPEQVTNRVAKLHEESEQRPVIPEQVTNGDRPDVVELRLWLEALVGDLTFHDHTILFREMHLTLRRQHISDLNVEDAEIAAVFRSFQLGLIIHEQAIASLFHDFLLWVINSNKRSEPKELYQVLQQIYKQFGNKEDADMWAAYCVGQFLEQSGDRTRAIGWLEKSYALSKTLPGKLYVSAALSLAYWGEDQYNLALDYCEKFKDSAMELQSNEYVFYSLIYSCSLSYWIGNIEEAQKMLKDLQSIPSESLYQERFFRGMSMSLSAELTFHRIGNCEEASVATKCGLELLKLVENDPMYEVKVYINSPNAPPTTRFFLTKNWIQRNEESLCDQENEAAIVNILEPASTEMPLERLQRLLKDGDFLQAKAWINELIDHLDDNATAYEIFTTCSEIIAACYTQANELGQEILMAEGLVLIEDIYKKCFPERSSLLALGAFGTYCVRAEKYDQGIELLSECLQKFLEVGFDDYSEGRMAHFECGKFFFRKLEVALVTSAFHGINCEEHAIQAVLWSERGKARDLAYMMNSRFGRDTYTNELCTFDLDDAHAWNEIQSICSLAGPHTAFLIFSRLDDCNLTTYFLHEAEEPFLYVTEFSHLHEFLLPRKGLEFSLATRLKKFRNRKLLEDMFDSFISHWKEKLNYYLIKKIVIVPSEELSTLPFASFYDREDEKYLIQNYAISYSPSLRLFQHCEMRRKLLREATPPGLRALVVGNPKLGDPLLDLAFAEMEADIVAQALCDAGYDSIEVLKREAATHENVLDGFSSSDWIHIASHAIVDAKHSHGAIILASPVENGTHHHTSNYNKRAKREHVIQYYERALQEHLVSSKNILEADEIANQQKLKARVVMLSACNSGLGETCADGILGLCRSFHMAGVPTVVASLWKVDDEATGILMTRCYENLKTGMEMIIALQEAMKFMIEEEDEFGQSRFNVEDWAPFIVSGTPFTILCEFQGKNPNVWDQEEMMHLILRQMELRHGRRRFL